MEIWILGFSIILVGFLISSLHELAHYLSGRLWVTDIDLRFCYGIWPCSVIWNDPDVPNHVIRVSGLAPLVVLIPGYFLVTHWVLPLLRMGGLNNYFTAVSLIGILIAGLPISRADRLAIFSPEEWRQRATANKNEDQ